MANTDKIEFDPKSTSMVLFLQIGLIAIFFSVFPNFSMAQDEPNPNPTIVGSLNTEKVDRAKELWKKGNILANKGFMDRAHEYWKVALELDPNLSQEGETADPASNIDISEGTASFRTNDKKQLRRLSKLLSDAKVDYDQKEFDKALLILNKAENISPQEPPIEAMREKIVLENFVSDPERPYNEMVKNDFEAAASDYRDGHYEPAMKSIEQAEKLDPDNTHVADLKELILKKNEAHLLNKEVKRAQEQWKDGDEEIALEVLSNLLKEHPGFHPALDLKDQIEKQDSNDRSAQIQKNIDQAQRAEKESRFLDAKSSYENALKLDPKNKIALAGSERMADLVDPLPGRISDLEAAIKKNQKDKAKIYLKEVEDLSPQNPKLALWKTKISQMTAAPVLDDQAKADETYNLGLESYRNNNFSDAKKFWSETLDLEPNHPQAKRNLARLLEDHPELK